MRYSEVAVIILNWNGVEDTIGCLESVKKMTYPKYDVVVVDNGSVGNDAQILKEQYGGSIHLIQNQKNLGFAGGVNVGLRYGLGNIHPEYFLLLNNDTVVDPALVDELVGIAETDERIGIIGPKIYYFDRLGKNNVIWSAGGKIQPWRQWIYHHIGEDDDDLPKYQKVAGVDWITGAALMLKSRVIEELGLFDASYFFGNEDVDYCLKARKHGFKIVYAPAARVWHKVGASKYLADPSPYFRFIKQNFSKTVYVYHLLTLPLLFLNQVLIYSTRYRNRKTLGRLFYYFANFVLRKHGEGS